MVSEVSRADRRMTLICRAFVGREPRLLCDRGECEPVPHIPNLLSFHPSQQLRQTLESNKYSYIQEFAILPSRSCPRWVLPLKATAMLNGLQLYVPFSTTGRLFKSFLRVMIRLGWSGQSGGKMLLASRERLPLHALVSELTGEECPQFALSLGNTSQFRALVVQAMRPDGEILGFIKLPITSTAATYIRHEAAVLQKLREGSAGLCGQIPRILYSGEWQNSFVLFQSAGPPTPGPLRFEEMHVDFLNRLHRVDCAERPGCELVEELKAGWHGAATDLDTEWQQVGEDALRTAGQLLEEDTLQCGLIHGDFAPWNTRQQNGVLYAFDWEAAKSGVPTIWDVFRFHERVAVLLNFKQISYPDDLKSRNEKASFLLYCMQSVLDVLASLGKDTGNKLRYYKHKLIQCMSRPV